jgi:hypothetical protein
VIVQSWAFNDLSYTTNETVSEADGIHMADNIPTQYNLTYFGHSGPVQIKPGQDVNDSMDPNANILVNTSAGKRYLSYTMKVQKTDDWELMRFSFGMPTSPYDFNATDGFFEGDEIKIVRRTLTGAITGTVENDNHQPLGNIPVQLWIAASDDYSSIREMPVPLIYTDANGRFAFDPVRFAMFEGINLKIQVTPSSDSIYSPSEVFGTEAFEGMDWPLGTITLQPKQLKNTLNVSGF